MKQQLIFRAADVAALFGVSRANVVKWQARPDAPPADFIDSIGVQYYLSLDVWVNWHNENVNPRRSDAQRNKTRKAVGR